MTFSKKQSLKTTFLQWQNSWLCMKHDSLSVILEAKMQKIYADLCVDIRRKSDINHTFSDGYDI